MNNRKDISCSKAACAGMAHATMGRNRVYGSSTRPEIDDSAEQIADALEARNADTSPCFDDSDDENEWSVGSYIPRLKERLEDEQLAGVCQKNHGYGFPGVFRN